MLNKAQLLTGNSQSLWAGGGSLGCRCVRHDTDTDEQSNRRQTEKDSRAKGLMATVNHAETSI